MITAPSPCNADLAPSVATTTLSIGSRRLTRRGLLASMIVIASVPLSGTANAHHRPRHGGTLVSTKTVPPAPTLILMGA